MHFLQVTQFWELKSTKNTNGDLLDHSHLSFPPCMNNYCASMERVHTDKLYTTQSLTEGVPYVLFWQIEFHLKYLFHDHDLQVVTHLRQSQY